jgi:hypothetical protein
MLGVGSILVEKEGGRCARFEGGSGTNFNLEVYEAGYLDHDDFDLVIIAISNLEEALELLRRLRIQFVNP